MMRPLGGAAIAFFVSPARVASTRANVPPFFCACSYCASRSIRAALPRRNIYQPAAARTTMTAAIRTARFIFIWGNSLSSFFHGCARFPIRLAALDRFAFVVVLLALREADRHFDTAVLEVHPDGDQGHPLLDGLPDQLLDLLPVQQELALPRGLVI